MMRKPLSKWAVFLWGYAGLVALADIAGVVIGNLHTYYFWKEALFWSTLIRIILQQFSYSVTLLGFGVMIEKVDRWRWQMLSESEKNEFLAARGIWWHVRNWPHGSTKL